MFTIDFAAELRDKKVTVTALHPATLMDTTLVREAGAQVMSTVDEGATAVMQQITGDVLSGQFYNGLRPARPARPGERRRCSRATAPAQYAADRQQIRPNPRRDDRTGAPLLRTLITVTIAESATSSRTPTWPPGPLFRAV
jgi:NAD(P)-dependent dehydrogenase (short-subunit alcohol dehydrogenase family)